MLYNCCTTRITACNRTSQLEADEAQALSGQQPCHALLSGTEASLAARQAASGCSIADSADSNTHHSRPGVSVAC
jgi:hypothetical protein